MAAISPAPAADTDSTIIRQPAIIANAGTTHGSCPLVAAAAPLLQRLARLRGTAHHPAPGLLRASAADALHQFEAETTRLNIPPEQRRLAHFALCASLDDVALSTPWGHETGNNGASEAGSSWAARPLLGQFHPERNANQLFEVLAALRRNPGHELPLLELIYLCLSLGFMGRYRLTPNGQAEIDQLRTDIHAIIHRQRPPEDPALAPHWRGAHAPYRRQGLTIPPWLAGLAALGLLAAFYATLLSSLTQRASQQLDAAIAAPPAAMPQIIRAPQPPAPPPAPSE